MVSSRIPRQGLFLEKYPELSARADPVFWTILERSRAVDAPPGTVFFRAGEPCEHFMWVLGGTVRVIKQSEEGRELTLYRVTAGDLCILSLNSLLHGRPHTTEARTDSGMQGLVFGGADFREALECSPGFRDYVLGSLTERIHELTELMAEVAFCRMDTRLACLLGRLFERSGNEPLTLTHDALAQEMGSTREVVSRNLKKLEQLGCIELRRGRIELREPEQLALAGSRPED